MPCSVDWLWAALSIGLASSRIPGLATLVFFLAETGFFLNMICALLYVIVPGHPEGHPDLCAYSLSSY